MDIVAILYRHPERLRQSFRQILSVEVIAIPVIWSNISGHPLITGNKKDENNQQEIC
ncbi:MAG: hypothetical protein MZV70_46385 [Desulfobacterales bacterium]|nr:hypothetical protein [Desulfobacterales bacterium]